MKEEVVTLTIPAKPQFAQSLRALAASLAKSTSLSFDETQDTRMMAEEAFIYALSTQQNEVNVRFALKDGTFTMAFSLGAKGENENAEAINIGGQDVTAPEFALMVLDSLTDSFSVNAENNLLTVVKNAKE